jgi:hypothetical protein
MIFLNICRIRLRRYDGKISEGINDPDMLMSRIFAFKKLIRINPILAQVKG